MAKMTAADLLRAFQSDDPPRLVFLCGEDTYATTQAEQKIRKRLTDGSAMADTVFDGQALDLDRLSDAAGFCPMFQPFNLILIRELDPALLSADQTEQLLDILSNTASQVVVLVVMRASQVYEIKRGAPAFLPAYKKIVSFFEKNGVLCVNEKKSANTLGRQIMERAKRHGSDISRRDAEELAARCLCDSTLIRNEMDKLLACADGSPITTEMLDALVAPLPDADAFKLARVVTAGNAPAAFALLGQLTARAEDTKTILGLLTILSSNFIDLYRAKLGQGASRSAEEVTADFRYQKNRAFAVGYAMRDCGSMSVPQLRTCVRILRETDKLCKSTRTPPRLLLEQAIVRMLQVRKDGTEAAP